MVVLMVGDIVGVPGCEHLRKNLPQLKAKYGVNITVVNGENSADGNGVSTKSAKHLFDSGVDVITGGNHSLRRQEIYEILDRRDGLIRPANYHETAPGMGYFVFDNCKYRLCVINLQGVVYMQSIQSPFDCIDALLNHIDTPHILVDFHAEATAEKLCMGYYLDGRVSAVCGTHTHIPTADGCILPGGTAYITDIGMCGGRGSVLGVRADRAISRMRTALPVRFETDTENIRLSGVVLQLDDSTGRCTAMEQILFI